MWALGKFVVLTRNELIETVNDEKVLAYRRGLHSKWKAKKLLEPPPPADALDPEYQLLLKVAPGVVIPGRNAETYAISPTTYGDSLPIVEDAELVAEIKARFDMKESEMEDAA